MKRMILGGLCAAYMKAFTASPTAQANESNQGNEDRRLRYKDVAANSTLESYAESALMFEPESAELTDETKKVLDHLALWLLRNPRKSLLLQQAMPVTGYPDFTPYEAIAEKRVSAIRRYIAEQGLPQTRVGYIALDAFSRDQVMRKEDFYTVVMMTRVPSIRELPTN